ncbi:MAG: homoserine dehydrogenase [Bacillota bacterium]|nr:homoserine dehydrogenase [Bacillota bacterium]
MVKVAILGFGVVGSGVAEVLTGNGAGISRKADDLVELKYILDVRDFPDSPFAANFVKDFSIIEQDPEVNVVVETIGGVGAALDFTERALKAGKSVVSSNKELVATHGRRLLELAAQHNVVYLFEASVGGGIPILRPLSECMAANDILEICGIVNGTANYIFTRMVQDGIPFEEALRGAQANGYAEQNPSADVEGMDTCRKLCILSSIAFGWHLLPEQVPTTGITKITLADEAYAAACGMRIKLLGRAIAQEDGSVCPFVEPHFVSLQDPLGGVEDVFNAIKVKGDAVGDVMFYGRGAGKLPTASAVVADVIAAARKLTRAGYHPWQANRPECVMHADKLASCWYVRLAQGDLPAGEKLSIAQGEAGESGWITGAMTRPALDQMLEGKKVLSVIRVLD